MPLSAARASRFGSEIDPAPTPTAQTSSPVRPSLRNNVALPFGDNTPGRSSAASAAGDPRTSCASAAAPAEAAPTAAAPTRKRRRPSGFEVLLSDIFGG